MYAKIHNTILFEIACMEMLKIFKWHKIESTPLIRRIYN